MNNVTDIFPKRLRELRGNKSQQEVADYLKISRVSLGYYESGERKPDIEVLSKLATYYKVTSDYLLGLSDNSTTDINTQNICQKTGLSDKTVENIIKLNQLDSVTGNQYTWLRGIDYLFSQNMLINIIDGEEPDEDYWDSVKGKDYKGSCTINTQGRINTFFYYGKGIDFLRNLNHILFDKYIDFNPYQPVGRNGNIISVINKENLTPIENTFTVLDDTGSSHIFNFSIITKALLLEMNELLTDLREDIKHEDTKEFIISVDERINNMYKLSKQRQISDYENETES